jgi:hypothetical protein
MVPQVYTRLYLINLLFSVFFSVNRKQFSQFHLEQDGRKLIRTPEWSLGKYVRTIVVRDRVDIANENAQIVKLVDFYEGGQHCDETNKPRSVEVHIQCCDSLNIPNVIPSEAYFQAEKTANPFPRAALARIMEPSVCAYQATVCSPLLCQRLDYEDEEIPSSDASSASSSSSSSAAAPTTTTTATTATGRKLTKRVYSKTKPVKFTEIMKTINSTCLARQEEWWTYELCFNKGVRQVRFNLEQSVTAEGTVIQKQVLANQYVLGTPPFDLYLNEPGLLNSTAHLLHSLSNRHKDDLNRKEQEIVKTFGMISPLFRTKGKEQNYLSLNFTNGTPCDLDHVNRSVVVELYCGMK